MKISKKFLFLGALVLGGVALAARFDGPFAGIDALPRYLKGGTFIGSASTASTTNKLSESLSVAATIDFAASSGGMVLSSAITLAGAALGDTCEIGPPTAAAALLGKYGCRVTAADEVKAWFEPGSMISSTCTLGGESPSVCPAQTVVAASVCTCSPVGTTAAIAAAGCAVSLSSTTLTITSLNGGSHVVNYTCRAPIDPASSSYEIRTFSND